MIKKRLIFTLLYDNGYFVLSRNFSLQRVGNLDWLIDNYDFGKISNYIDELIILNVRDKEKNFENFSETIKKLSKTIFIPIAAGGGIKSIDDVKIIMRSGADKIVCNTLLLQDINKIIKIKKLIGQQSIVGSLDIKFKNNDFFIFNNEKKNSNQKVSDFCKNNQINDIIGEAYINSIDKDGTGQGYMIDIIDEVKKYSSIPLILAGGAGNWKHLLLGLQNKNVNAVATANLLNFVGNGLSNARNQISKQFDLPSW